AIHRGYAGHQGRSRRQFETPLARLPVGDHCCGCGGGARNGRAALCVGNFRSTRLRCAWRGVVGKAALGDWRTDAPLVRRKITELPPPYATRSASNPPRLIAKPASAAPKVPPGFQVELFAANLHDPRTVRVAPNGDIFVAESEPGRVRVLRAADGASQPETNEVFASGLQEPFGVAFYPPGS